MPVPAIVTLPAALIFEATPPEGLASTIPVPEIWNDLGEATSWLSVCPPMTSLPPVCTFIESHATAEPTATGVPVTVHAPNVATPAPLHGPPPVKVVSVALAPA